MFGEGDRQSAQLQLWAEASSLTHIPDIDLVANVPFLPCRSGHQLEVGGKIEGEGRLRRKGGGEEILLEGRVQASAVKE